MDGDSVFKLESESAIDAYLGYLLSGFKGVSLGDVEKYALKYVQDAVLRSYFFRKVGEICACHDVGESVG